VSIFSKRKIIGPFKKSIEKSGLKYSENPDLVISLGGDGTFLRAERKFPGMPKLLVRDSKICEKCDIDSFEDEVLKKIKNGKYKIKESIKLEAKLNNEKIRNFYAMNEFSIRNRYQTNAIRFLVEVNKRSIAEEIIGDGIVVSAPFGSTGYFNSITGQKFKKGIGIGFNNPTKKLKNLVISENSKVRIRLVRGVANLSCDNDPKIYRVKRNDVIEIWKSSRKAKIVEL